MQLGRRKALSGFSSLLLKTSQQLKLEMCWAQSLRLCYAFFSPKKVSSFLYLIYIQQKFNL
ncbi:hypothetical protein J539_1931 [Acinetobacter baumannii 342950]|nr:hypothetical protein J539_1931 [Acinetobacter baumannii 342950]